MRFSFRYMYRRLLVWLCRKELRCIHNADHYPPSRKELADWHDLMAIECMNRPRMLRIMVRTAMALDTPQTEGDK